MLPTPPGGQLAASDGVPRARQGTGTPNAARIWNYWVGGKDYYAADREVGEQVMEALPDIPAIARATRLFLIRSVQLLAAGYGFRQFLDIGPGLPTACNTHEVAQRAAPESRVVYVDHDPVVIAHARALLTSSAEGATGYVQADLRDTGTILAEAAPTLDLSRPVAVLLLAVLHFIPDGDDPYALVKQLMDATSPGSYLAIAHGASDITPARVAEAARRYNAKSAEPLTLRSLEQVSRFFDGMEPAGTGVAALSRRVTAENGARAGRLACYCGIARKP